MSAYRKLAESNGLMTACARCGLAEVGILEVHHKDRDRENNKLENLEVLCPSCHKLEHKGDTNRRGRMKGLTPPRSLYTIRLPDDLRRMLEAEAADTECTLAATVVNMCWMGLESRIQMRHGSGGAPQGGDGPPKPVLVGSSPTAPAKPTMDDLRAICAGNVRPSAAAPAVEVVQPVADEIPICGKTWWEEGEHWECLMDAGHREFKHGLRGMARKLDE